MRTLLVLAAALFIVASPSVITAQTAASDDLATRVAEAVRLYPQLSVFDDVNVDVKEATVTLSGCVTMPYKRDGIAARVAKVDGVRTVTNDIHVLPPSTTDSDLRTRIAQAIYGHPGFWRYASMAVPPIRIIVSSGRVTLNGLVDTEVDRTLAFTLAHVPGTSGVTNKLRVER